MLVPPESKSGQAEVVYLLDLSSYIYRAYHAIRELSTSQGFPTNAIYGVTNMLAKVLRDRQPTYLALVFDAKPPTFRHQLYPQYKANRPGMPEDLVQQLAYLRQIIAAWNLPTLELPGYEADDLIATLTRQAREAGLTVEIISGDKDLLPLVQPGVTVWDPMREVRYTPELIQEKFGVPPALLVDLRALTGDASDNIPGVPGIGPKTAQKLLQRFRALDELLQHLDEVPEAKLRQRLQEYQDQALQARSLLRLDDQVPLPVSVLELRPGPPDRTQLYQLFTTLEFRRLAQEIQEAQPQGDFRLLGEPHGWQELAAALKQGGQTALYCLAGPQHPMMGELGGVAWSNQNQTGYYCLLADSSATAAFWQQLGPLWAEPAMGKIGADLKQVSLWGAKAGWETAGLRGDILLASYLLNPTLFEQTLENVAAHYGGVRLLSARELAGRPLAPTDLPPELAAIYAGSRAAAAWELWPRLEKLLQEEGLWTLYQELELPLLPVLAAMERCGIAVDAAFLHRLGQEFEREAQLLEQEIYDLAGGPFLIQSPPQLAAVLFDRLKLPVQKKTRSRTAYSTDNEVLQALAADHPIAAKIISYRSLMKLKSTYIDGLLKQINPQTGRVHTTFVQSAVATGRLSSRDPNLQNIPVRGEAGSQLRQAFIAAPGKVLLSADYSQIELRLLAHFSEDATLVAAFRAGQDIHRQTAAEVFGLQPELVTPLMRRQAKVINFGIIYGMSAFGLAKELGISQRLAQDFIARYFARHPGVQEYCRRVLAQAREQGWVSTLRGRRRPVPQLESRNPRRRQEAERIAINTPLQGSAADLIKEAMLRVDRSLKTAGLEGQLLLQIHDELILEVPPAELEVIVPLVKEAMEGAAELKVPLIVDIKTGANWGALEPWPH